jgi:LytS/YehU family sensor histidine kinase
LFSESFGFAAIFAAVIAIEHYRSLVETEQRASRLEKDLAEMQLQMLRAQIDPHFLFNALNGISALIETDPAGAQEMLSRLSALLRLALAAGSSQEVPLRDELIFVERYLDIMRVRFGERLQTCIDVSHDLLDERVPSLLLQPLVENCVRHGMHASPKTTTIDVTAVRDARSLRLTVTDDGTGLGPHPPRANGIGLGHTRRRLHHLYGDGATLHVADRPGGGTAVTITLPRREVVRYE